MNPMNASTLTTLTASSPVGNPTAAATGTSRTMPAGEGTRGRVVRPRHGHDPSAEAGAQQVQVHQDADADREGGHGHRGPQEQGAHEVHPEPLGEGVPEAKREDELRGGDDVRAVPQGLSESLRPDLEPRRKDE